MALFRWVTSFIPGLLAGLLLTFFFQYKKLLTAKFAKQIAYIKDICDRITNKILTKMPRYKNIRKITSKVKV